MRWLIITVLVASIYNQPSKGQVVMLEVPLSVDLGGQISPMIAFSDGTHLWVDIADLAKHMGFDVAYPDSSHVLLRDANRAIVFSPLDSSVTVNNEVLSTGVQYQRGVSGQMLVSMPSLQTAFGSDIAWDPFALTLRLSRRATLFTPTKREVLPAPRVFFPRSRTLLGGAHFYYDVRHSWSQSLGSNLSAYVTANISVGGGVMRTNLSRTRPGVNYQIPIDQPWLSHLSVAWRHGDDMPAFVISNRPLVPRTRFSTRSIEGITFPHAIVESVVGGETIERIQADIAGRYRVDVPIFYGTTRSSVKITPLGHSPLDALLSYELTPPTALPKHQFEYEARYRRGGFLEGAYGVSDRATVRAQIIQTPLAAIVGTTLRVSPSMYAEVDANILDQVGTVTLRQWRSWGQWDMRYRKSTGSHSITGLAIAQLGRLSLSGSVAHQRYATRSFTRITPSVGLQTSLGLEFQLRGHIFQTTSTRVGLTPTLIYARSIGRLLGRITAAAVTESGAILEIQSGLHLSKRLWTVTLGARRHIEAASTELVGSVQLNTDWAWLGFNGENRGGDVVLSQNARGTVGIGRGLTFSSIHRENAKVIFRFFEDLNRNGEKDGQESIVYGATLRGSNFGISRRFSGDLVTGDLSPNATYTATIEESSIDNPMLYPATGYRFGFVAQAGRTRILEIPLQPMIVMTGAIQGWDRANELLQIEMINDEDVSQTLDVYRDGGFFAQISRGTYVLIIRTLIDGKVLYRGTHTITQEPLIIDISP